MQAAIVTEWLNLAVRVLHVIVAIMWIGSSLFFNWLDARIEQNERTRQKKSEGELWMVHSGGFYEVDKKLVAPSVMPERLHWFKWEAAFTLLSGWLLLDIVFFRGGGVTLVDPNVSSVSPTAATSIVVALLVGSWFVYDLLWRSPLAKNVYLGASVTYALVVAVLYELSHLLSGRAAYLVTGAMMGTWMAANVWVHIIPAQKRLVGQVETRRAPDPMLARRAKARSRHNNYMTYPVVLIMVSNHFPVLYAADSAWMILAALVLAGSAIRHLQNVRRHLAPAILIAVLVALLAIAHSPLSWSRAESVARATEGAGGARRAAPLGATRPSSTGGPREARGEVGSIEGTIRVDGEPPLPQPMSLGACSSEATAAVLSDAVLVKDGKLQNAFVWIKKGLEAYDAPPAPSAPVVIDQKGCLYSPRVVGARAGQQVVFLNSDPVLHNVRTVADDNGTFNEIMPTRHTRLVKSFDKTEVVVRAKCDVHPWMVAFVGVVPHPYFAVSSDAGEIALENVPSGDYEVEAWHEIFGRRTERVKVEANKAAQLAITFRAE